VAATENGQRTFDLSVVTPEGTAFEGEARILISPAFSIATRGA
jgi:F0F1-type ATP synthase epsilon subunit